MARKLKNETIKALRADNQLLTDYANILNISVFSLPTLLYRDSRVLMQHDALKFLASRLNKTIDEITENSEAGSKVMA